MGSAESGTVTKILYLYYKHENWRIRYNEELNRFIKGKDIVKFIKAQRIRLLGHVKRMEAGAMPRGVMEGGKTVYRRTSFEMDG